MAELIARRYAQALFEAGEDLGKIDLFYEELSSLGRILSKEEKFLILMDNPKINKKEKKELLDNIFADQLSEEVVNFLYILVDKNRQRNLLEIVDIYEDLYYEYKGIIRVVAVTAEPMKEDRKERLTQVLREKLSKEVELSNRLDESVIGGVRLELEGKLIDGTVKGRLDSMAKMLNTAIN